MSYSSLTTARPSPEFLLRRLRDGGVRITAQRRAVASALVEVPATSDLRSLTLCARRWLPRIQRRTVRLTLALFHRLGVLDTLLAWRNGVAEIGQASHYRGVVQCVRCGHREHVTLPHQQGNHHLCLNGFVLTGYRLEFLGLCPHCEHRPGTAITFHAIPHFEREVALRA